MGSARSKMASRFCQPGSSDQPGPCRNIDMPGCRLHNALGHDHLNPAIGSHQDASGRLFGAGEHQAKLELGLTGLLAA